MSEMQTPGRHALEEQARERKKKSHIEIRDVLNINSLMDIMTILLVFLLVSITSDPLNIRQSDDLLLAKSTANFTPEDSIPITITKRHVIVDNKLVLQIKCKIAGHECTEQDYADKAKCANPNNHCPPDRVQQLEAMTFYIDKADKKDSDENSFLVVPLLKRLKDLVERQKRENERLGRPFKGIATFIADRDLPYRVIVEVAHTAGEAGIFDMRYAIIKTNTRYGI